MAKNVLTYNLSEPLCGATIVKVDIHTDDGNLTIDRLTGGEALLASGTLEYLEKNGLPTHVMDERGGEAAFSLKASGAGPARFRLPWQACNAATHWQIHLNPGVQSDISAYTGGGNLWLDLTGMAVTRLSADSGGGNLDVILPDNAANLDVTAQSGAGNVTVRVPGDMAALIHAATGLGKVIVDSRFTQIDKNTYRSPDYDNAASKVEINMKSGAGNVSVLVKEK